MKKVFKYPTGAEIPEGAVYLSTQVEIKTEYYYVDGRVDKSDTTNVAVWHYFLVEVDDEQN